MGALLRLLSLLIRSGARWSARLTSPAAVRSIINAPSIKQAIKACLSSLKGSKLLSVVKWIFIQIGAQITLDQFIDLLIEAFSNDEEKDQGQNEPLSQSLTAIKDAKMESLFPSSFQMSECRTGKIAISLSEIGAFNARMQGVHNRLWPRAHTNYYHSQTSLPLRNLDGENHGQYSDTRGYLRGFGGQWIRNSRIASSELDDMRRLVRSCLIVNDSCIQEILRTLNAQNGIFFDPQCGDRDGDLESTIIGDTYGQVVSSYILQIDRLCEQIFDLSNGIEAIYALGDNAPSIDDVIVTLNYIRDSGNNCLKWPTPLACRWISNALSSNPIYTFHLALLINGAELIDDYNTKAVSAL